MDVRLWKGQYEFLTSDKMFTYLICGRGYGKSFITAHKILQSARRKRPSIVVSPTFKQLTFSIFRELNTLLRSVPVSWKFDSKMNTYDIGGVPVYGFTANNNNYENMRGMSAADLFLDEAREYDKIVLDTAIPCLRGYGPPCINVTTSPKGMNWLGVDIKRRLRDNDPDFKLITGTSFENKELDKSFFKMMQKNLSGDFLRQELYGEIIDSDMEDTLFGYTLLEAACDRGRDGTPRPDDFACIGLDCARFGDDQTCAVLRIGRLVVTLKRMGKTDTNQSIDMVLKLVDVCKSLGVRLDAICIDAACGSGVIDGLRDIFKDGIPVFEVNFNEKSPDPQFYNMRAFMYFTAKQWCDEGGYLGEDEMLREDLSVQRYFIHSDKSYRLVPKELIKKLTGRSPDTSDGFVLTFYAGALALALGMNKKKFMDSPHEIQERHKERIKNTEKTFDSSDF